MKTNPDMNAKIAGILRTGNTPSQYATQRIAEMEAEIERLRTWEYLALQLWHKATPDPDDEIGRKAFVDFLAAADDQLEQEQGHKVAEAAKEDH